MSSRRFHPTPPTHRTMMYACLETNLMIFSKHQRQQWMHFISILNRQLRAWILRVLWSMYAMMALRRRGRGAGAGAGVSQSALGRWRLQGRWRTE